MPHKHSNSVKSLFFAHLTRNLFRMITFHFLLRFGPGGAEQRPLLFEQQQQQHKQQQQHEQQQLESFAWWTPGTGIDTWDESSQLVKKILKIFYVKSKRNIFFFFIKVVPPSWSHSELYSQPEYCEWESFQQLQ